MVLVVRDVTRGSYPQRGGEVCEPPREACGKYDQTSNFKVDILDFNFKLNAFVQPRVVYASWRKLNAVPVQLLDSLSQQLPTNCRTKE